MSSIAAISAASTGAIIASQAAHNSNCFTLQSGEKFCKEEPITPHQGGFALLIIGIVLSYILSIFFLAMNNHKYDIAILTIGLIAPFFIFGLILL